MVLLDQQDQVDKFGKWNNRYRYCYLYSFNGTNTLTTSIVTQQTINVNSTAPINGQSQSVYFEVGALLQYSVPNSGENSKSSEQYHQQL
jgi:hypothetical protein